ncbi:DNA primase [Erythrobacter arachoides]|uniref:DNA primase n=1 Tax=Aurantiacibacter arachoides TaxID=1850444 RepID=A0A845A0N7_9SPHN|nr:DNA primase [Aurantiacibacter arachoides]MXO93284.1 DNA primase [Aurantiacibacter arachoides]GGD50521.1 DNA primase [Aurantiacibacter arachoides]
MALSPQWLDELKSRITLSTLIGRTTKLTRAGREWKACCPFHSENTPSFTVNDQKGFYHCFGCQAHGSAIDWMIEQRGLEFMDAVKELATQAGMEVPAPDPRAARQAEKRASLHDVMAAAQDWFVARLASDEGVGAREYLARRGLTQRTLEHFGFGYAPDDKQAMAKALGKFETAMLVEAGLLIDVEDKLPYARFRGRVMLPIHDPRGRVIAFGGRILEDRDGVAKYLNSPDTPLFDKGRTLYNLHRAGPASRKTNRLVAVEGYMDVIALAQAGYEDAVAPMGTALTDSQIELMWRMVDKPIVCFDGDNAGRRAAIRAAERVLPMLRPGHSLGVVTLPQGLDPDDLIKQQGAGAMEPLLANPGSIVDLIWDHEQAALPLSSPEDKAGLKARLLAHVDTIAHPDIRSLYRRDLIDRYGAFAFPKREFAPRTFQPGGKFRKPGPATQSAEVTERLRLGANGASRDRLTQAVLNGFLRHPDLVHRHADSLLALGESDRSVAGAVDYLLENAAALEARENPPISGSGVLPPPPGNARFTFLLEGSDPDDARQDLAEAVALLIERPALDVAIAAATRRFESDPEGSIAEQQRLRKRKLEIESRLGQMARERAARDLSGAGEEHSAPVSVDGDTAEQETD